MKIRKILVHFIVSICTLCIVASMASATDPTAIQDAQKGISLMKRGNIDQAITQFKQAISKDQNFVDAHYNLGMLYHLKAAEKNQVNPKDIQGAIPIQSYKKKWKAGLEELRLAETEFKEVIRLQPSAADAHFKLGLIYDNMGDTENAIREYRDAMKLDPRGPDGLDARNNYALILHFVKGNSKEAIKELQTVLSINPNHFAKENIKKIQASQK
jgi:tetratricopeptide (TPR) repeat protein